MPDLSTDTPVAELVTDVPARARVFEQLGIDYCCGGDQSLAEACRKNDLDPPTVAQMLDATAAAGSSESQNWRDAPLGELIDHIKNTHHAYLRRELPRLRTLLNKVVSAHGRTFSWLHDAQSIFQSLANELVDHMQSEEEYVFPAIRTLDEGRVLPDGSTLDTDAIEKMEAEHDEAGSMLEQLRAAANDYAPPEGACPKFLAVLDGLEELEADMHRHVHKENNLLFPRARSLA